jgi:predicted DNA-binding transcriptional regulator YafY
MSNEAQIKRWQIILELLREDNKTTFIHIKNALTDFEVSERNIRRDIEKLRNEFHLNIIYHKKSNTYELKEDEHLVIFEKLLLSFSMGLAMNQVLQEKENLAKFIQISQNENYNGTKYLSQILQAIINQKKLTLLYQPFNGEEATTYLIEPYLLKEFENRWYLLGANCENKSIESYALERIEHIHQKESFKEKCVTFDPEEFFKYTFGIYANAPTKPQKVVLSFEPHTGKYIKTRPLHHSQKILINDENELQISLFVTLTYDLEQRILFHHSHVKVIEPEILAKNIQERLEKALKRYDE